MLEKYDNCMHAFTHSFSKYSLSGMLVYNVRKNWINQTLMSVISIS